MKKEIPMPLVVAIVVLVVAVGGFFFVRGLQGPPEFEPVPLGTKTPEHIKAALSPEDRAEIERMEREAGLTEESAPQQPTQNPYAGSR